MRPRPKAAGSCTHGRLFIADAESAKVHVLDLDDEDYAVLASLDAPIPAARLVATETDLATVVSVDRKSGGHGAPITEEGSVHFYSSGLTAEEHGDHHDLIKRDPSKHSFTLTGWAPTHVTSSAGYVSVFMDGAWSPDPAEGVHNSSAIFVKEARLAAGPTPIEVPLEGAHHGVSYALSDDHFLVSVSTEARVMQEADASALPDHFMVAGPSGGVLHELGDHESPSCPGYHGSAHSDNTWVMGCGAGGWLRISYDAGASPPASWATVPFPSPLAGVDFRSGTVKSSSSRNGGVFVADLYPLGPKTPRYAAPVPAEGSSMDVDNLVQLNRDAAENDVCHWALARRAGGTHLAFLNKDGTMTVAEVALSGDTGEPKSLAVFGEEIDCADTALVAGPTVAYVIVAGATPRVLTVSLGAIDEGRTDHAVTSKPLSFTPAGGALALPPSVACEEGPGGHDGHDHGPGDDTDTDAAGRAGSVLLSLFALLGPLGL